MVCRLEIPPKRGGLAAQGARQSTSQIPGVTLAASAETEHDEFHPTIEVGYLGVS